MPIFLISGTPGAGKSSVATALVQRFQFGLHIPMDDIREWVVAGRADPIPVWTDETTRQFHLSRQSALYMARLYADSGFAVAIDDVLFEQQVQAEYAQGFAGYEVHKILLSPSLEVALRRNATRTNKAFDTTVLIDGIKAIHQALLEQNQTLDGWLLVDTSNLSLEATVDAILSKISE